MSGLLDRQDVALPARAARARLAVLAAAQWPEPGDAEPPKLAGFVHSTFNPIIAAVAGRCLTRRAQSAPPGGAVALVLVSALGDIDSAVHVAGAVDAGTRVGPLFFFQSVPNAVLGHIAARWALTGPVSCVCDTATGLATSLGLLADGDAEQVLLIEIDRPETHDDTRDDTGDDTGDIAAAVLVADGGPS
jgi:hypothetical protein